MLARKGVLVNPTVSPCIVWISAITGLSDRFASGLGEATDRSHGARMPRKINAEAAIVNAPRLPALSRTLTVRVTDARRR